MRAEIGSWRVHGDHSISSDVRAGASVVGLSMEGGEPRTEPDGRVGATHVSGSRGRGNV